MTEIKVNNIPHRQRCINKEHPYTSGARDIYDDVKEKNQEQINKDVDNALDNRYTKNETYNKTELNNMVTTPEVKYVNVEATDQTTDISDVLPATGAADTIYKIGSWDGSQYDASKYSEYTWNGSAYVYLATRDHGVDDTPTYKSKNLTISGAIAFAEGETKNRINNKILADDSGFSVLSLDFVGGLVNPITGVETDSEDYKTSAYYSVDDYFDGNTVVFDGTDCLDTYYVKYNALREFTGTISFQGQKLERTTLGSNVKFFRICCKVEDNPRVITDYKGSFIRKTDGKMLYERIFDSLENVGGTLYNDITWENKGISIQNNNITITDSDVRLLSPELPNNKNIITALAGYNFRVVSVDEMTVSTWVTTFDTSTLNTDTIYINVRRADGDNIAPSEGKYGIHSFPYTKCEGSANELLKTKTIIKNGGISAAGIYFVNDIRALTGYLLLPPKKIIETNSGYDMRVCFFDDDHNYVSYVGWTSFYMTTSNARVRIMIRKTSNESITPEEAEAAIKDSSVLYGYYDFAYSLTEKADTDCFNSVHNHSFGMGGTYYWNYPHLVHANTNYCNRLFFGYVTEYRVSGVGCYDLDKEQVYSIDLFNSETDEHDDMTVYYHENTGRLFAFGFKHNKESLMRVYGSVNRRNPLYFKRLGNIWYSDVITYAQIFYDTTNSRFALLTRLSNTQWVVRYSTDETCEEWGEEQVVFHSSSVEDGIQLYIAARPTTTENVLQMVVYGNPHWNNYSDSRIRLCYLNISTGVITNATGTTIGNIGTGIDYSAIPVIVSGCAVGAYTSLADNSKLFRLYDALPGCDVGHPVIAFGYSEKNNRTSGHYRVYDMVPSSETDYETVSEKVCDYGYALYETGDMGEGVFFVGTNNDRLLLGRKLNADGSDVDRNDGNSGYSVIEDWRKANGTWAKFAEIGRAYSTMYTSRVIRPITDLNGEFAMYQKGKCLIDYADNPFSYEAIVKDI